MQVAHESRVPFEEGNNSFSRGETHVTCTENDPRQAIELCAQAARKASRQLRTASAQEKNMLLRAMAKQLRGHVEEIITQNARDYAREQEKGMTPSLLDRLLLNEKRIEALALSLEHIASLSDPIGEIVSGGRLENGLRLQCIRVPMGVIGMIYEARPNVTVDAVAISLKAGSAAILRGGSAARCTNSLLVALMRNAVKECGWDPNILQSIDEWGREGAVALMRARGFIDVVIPRGGAGLIQTVVRESLVPVIETGVGNCHIYVDKYANLSHAHAIVINAKTQRPGVCNAAETLLVHADVAHNFLPSMLRELHEAGVVIHGCERTRQFAQGVPVIEADEEDWQREYLDLEIAVRIVNSLEEACEHIRTYSTGHTEAIISEYSLHINTFIEAMDSAAVMVNASTRFTDGGEFGFGAEIGISTQKLHARGPMGIRELTTTMWIVQGEGHVRK